MKIHYKILFSFFLVITSFYLYFKIDDYFDDKIIQNNNFYNCKYWAENHKDNESNTKYINYMILTFKECKLKNQDSFLFKNLDNTSYIGTDFLSGKKFYIDQRVIESLNIIYNKNYNKDEWKKELEKLKK